MFAQIRNTQMQSNPQNNIPCVFSPGRAKVEGFSVCSRTDVQAGHMLADLIEHLAANKNKATRNRPEALTLQRLAMPNQLCNSQITLKNIEIREVFSISSSLGSRIPFCRTACFG